MHKNLLTTGLLLLIITLLGTIICMMVHEEDIPDAARTVGSEPIATEINDSTPATNDTTADTTRKPNVLLIILDDIGLDYFPGYLEDQNFLKANMPVTESLMSDGYVFNNLHTYSMCSPTRASLLTGHHGVDTGVLDPGRTSYLDPSWQSIQEEIEQLSDNTITSAVIGKWHLLGRDADITHPNLFVDHYEGIPTGNHESYYSWDKVVNGVLIGSDTYATTDFTDAAINWIDEQDGQWFTWLAYTAPHTPIHLPPEELHSITGLSGSEQDMRRNKEQYFLAMLESVDTEIGRLLDSLDPETRNNTYVMIIGDNGTGGNLAQEPYRSVGAKGSLQVGGVHTPMVVYSPYQNGNGTNIDTLVSTIDFFPTVLDVFDLDTSMQLPGSSLYSLIADTNQTYNPHEFVYFQDLESTGVRSTNYKLIRFETGEERFYHIANDPFEETNLLESSSVAPAAHTAGYQSVSTALDNYLNGIY